VLSAVDDDRDDPDEQARDRDDAEDQAHDGSTGGDDRGPQRSERDLAAVVGNVSHGDQWLRERTAATTTAPRSATSTTAAALSPNVRPSGSITPASCGSCARPQRASGDLSS